MGRPKKAAAAVKTRGQNTLSFTGKITKPSAAISKVGKPVDQKPAKKQDVVEIATDSRASTPASVEAPSEQPADQKLALRQQPPAAPEEPSKALSVEEEEALNLTDARIRKYWKAKEDQRLHPRVHQQGLPIHTRILREFDLSSQFGPSIGIARTRRWQRAHKLGLNPPLEVLAVLMKSEAPVETREKSQVDDLMASKFAIEA